MGKAVSWRAIKSYWMSSRTRSTKESRAKVIYCNNADESTAIDVDSSLAPSLHTRSKGNVRMLNEFIPKNITQE